MIRSVYYAPEGRMRTDLAREEIVAALQQAAGLLWVDLVDESPENCRPLLEETFGFHPLAVDDALDETHVPNRMRRSSLPWPAGCSAPGRLTSWSR